MTIEKDFEINYAFPPGGVDLRKETEMWERHRILQALGETEGNISQASLLLNMARSTLSMAMKRLGLRSEQGKGH